MFIQNNYNFMVVYRVKKSKVLLELISEIDRDEVL